MSRKKDGFTLVELVVAIAILSILVGIAIPRFLTSNATARGSKIIADLNTCETAINIYFAQNGHFPSKDDDLVGKYLGVWPKAPIGKAIIHKYDATELELTVQTENYEYVLQNEGAELNARVGRVTLGGYTVGDLLNATESSLTLSDG